MVCKLSSPSQTNIKTEHKHFRLVINLSNFLNNIRLFFSAGSLDQLIWIALKFAANMQFIYIFFAHPLCRYNGLQQTTVYIPDVPYNMLFWTHKWGLHALGVAHALRNKYWNILYLYFFSLSWTTCCLLNIKHGCKGKYTNLLIYWVRIFYIFV